MWDTCVQLLLPTHVIWGISWTNKVRFDNDFLAVRYGGAHIRDAGKYGFEHFLTSEELLQSEEFLQGGV